MVDAELGVGVEHARLYDEADRVEQVGLEEVGLGPDAAEPGDQRDVDAAHVEWIDCRALRQRQGAAVGGVCVEDAVRRRQGDVVTRRPDLADQQVVRIRGIDGDDLLELDPAVGLDVDELRAVRCRGRDRW